MLADLVVLCLVAVQRAQLAVTNDLFLGLLGHFSLRRDIQWISQIVSILRHSFVSFSLVAFRRRMSKACPHTAAPLYTPSAIRVGSYAYKGRVWDADVWRDTQAARDATDSRQD